MSKIKILVFICVMLMFTLMYAYSIEAGYFDDALGIMFSQKSGTLYMGTGISINKVALLLNQRIGLSYPKERSKNFFIKSGFDASLMLAYNQTSAILFSIFTQIEFKYENFKIGVGLFKGLKALNYSNQIVDFDLWSPEAEIGYVW